MRKLKYILPLLVIVLIMSTLQAGNYAEKKCVRSFNTMNKYVKKTKLNAKAGSYSSMRVNFNMAKTYSANAIVECEHIRPELSRGAERTFDQLIAIKEAREQAVEDAKWEAERKRDIAAAEAEVAEAEAERQRDIEEAEAEAAEAETELEKEIAAAEAEAQEEMN